MGRCGSGSPPEGVAVYTVRVNRATWPGELLRPLYHSSDLLAGSIQRVVLCPLALIISGLGLCAKEKAFEVHLFAGTLRSAMIDIIAESI